MLTPGAQNSDAFEVEGETALSHLRLLLVLGRQTEKGVRMLGSWLALRLRGPRIVTTPWGGQGGYGRSQENIWGAIPWVKVSIRNCYPTQSPAKGSNSLGIKVRFTPLEQTLQSVRLCLKVEQGLVVEEGSHSHVAHSTVTVAPVCFSFLTAGTIWNISPSRIWKNKNYCISMFSHSPFPSLQCSILRAAEFILSCRMVKWGPDGTGKEVDTPQEILDSDQWVACDFTSRSRTCPWAVILCRGEDEWVCSSVLSLYYVSFVFKYLLSTLSSNPQARNSDFILDNFLSLTHHSMRCQDLKTLFLKELSTPISRSKLMATVLIHLSRFNNHFLNCFSAFTFPFQSYQKSISF